MRIDGKQSNPQMIVFVTKSWSKETKIRSTRETKTLKAKREVIHNEGSG